MADLKAFISKVADGENLSEQEAAAAFDIMMSGEATPAQIGGLLMGMRVRGETVEEITGAARTMRAKATPVKAPASAIDTCGTGGDAKGTYNISTCAAFVVAGAGVPVAKHGNRSVSSKSGSADVLRALGANLDVTPVTVAACIRQAGVGFMFAPAHHAAMKYVGPSRQDLGVRTIFNLLGPISNPAGTKRQLIGVFSQAWLEPLANVLKNLGSERIWVVHGSDGLDELTTTGPTFVVELKDGKVSRFEIAPEEAGVERAKPKDLLGGKAEENAAAVRAVLGGDAGPFRDIVILNAAAALTVSGKCENIADGARLAAEVIDSGKARQSLDKLVEMTNREDE